MKEESKSNRFQMNFVFLIFIVILCIATLAFIFNNRRPENIAKRNLKKVIKTVLIFPDKSVNEFFNDPTGEDLNKEEKDELPSIGANIHESVKPYFTEKGANEFLSHWYTFGFFCAGTDWKAKVKNIDISIDSKSSKMLSFKAVITCYKSVKEQQELVVTGRAQYGDTGLLSYWNLSGDSINKMMNLNEQFLTRQ